MERYDKLTDEELLKRLSENPPDTPDWIKSNAEMQRRALLRGGSSAPPELNAKSSRFGGFDPLSLLRAATEAVPATKWAVGVVGLAAAAAIILSVTKSPIFGVVGIAGVFVAMIALFVFSRLLAVAAAATRPAAVFLMWFMVVVFTATITCLFTSAFFNAPWPLRDRLFTSAVAARAESQGLQALATAARGLSEAALSKLVQLNDSRNMVGYFEPDSNVFILSPIPPAVRELDTHGLVTWSEPKQSFAEFARRYGLDLNTSGPEPQRVILDNLSVPERQRLREFSYSLNERGLSLYRLIIETVLKQLHE